MKKSQMLLAIAMLLMKAKDGEVKFLLVNVEERAMPPPDFDGNYPKFHISLFNISCTNIMISKYTILYM